MTPIHTVAQVFDAIQQAKAGASAFTTNFFPAERRLQGWIAHGELLGEFSDGVTFFLRRDRDFWRFYFCAASVTALEQEAAKLAELKTERVMADLVGQETALGALLVVLESAGFRRYGRLQRMARSGPPGQPPSADDEAPVAGADKADAPAILELLEGSFDRYADQLPLLYEVEAAIESRQMLVIKCNGALAALLFFETHGFTSTIRYWVVAEPFRAHRFGAALMRHYFASQTAVRRFLLWVAADNGDAVRKYRHYGYEPDGLLDHILANATIRP